MRHALLLHGWADEIGNRQHPLVRVLDRDRVAGPLEQLDVVLTVPERDRSLSRKAEMLASYDSAPELDPRYRREAKASLEECFRMIDDPNDVRRRFVDGRCRRKQTM